jgi:hypothetical protein
MWIEGDAFVTLVALRPFKAGDRVRFRSADGPGVEGVVTKDEWLAARGMRLVRGACSCTSCGNRDDAWLVRDITAYWSPEEGEHVDRG